MSLAETISQYRVAKGYTKSRLATMVGTSEPTISRIESGKIKSIKSDKIPKFAQVLGIPIEKLL